MRIFALLLVIVGCRGPRTSGPVPLHRLERVLDLGPRGQLVLGERLAVTGGTRVWPEPPGVHSDCAGPCYNADSAYRFTAPLPYGLDHVVAALDEQGRIHAILAFYPPGTPFSQAFAHLRARFGTPTCGSSTGPWLPVWLDSTTAIAFYGSERWDPRSPMALVLLERTHPRVTKDASSLSCEGRPPNRPSAPPVPASAEEYDAYKQAAIDFIKSRNLRILTSDRG